MERGSPGKGGAGTFVVGKTASCAALALTVDAYVWPGQAHAVAVAAVVALTAVNYGGVQKSAWLTRLIVALVLAVLACVVVVCLVSGAADAVDAVAVLSQTVREAAVVVEDADVQQVEDAGYIGEETVVARTGPDRLA